MPHRRGPLVATVAAVMAAAVIALPAPASAAPCTPPAPTIASAARGRLSIGLGTCSPAVGYRVTVVDGTTLAPVAGRDVPADATVVPFTGLAAGGRFRAVVRALDALDGEGPASAPSAQAFVPFTGATAAVQRQYADFAGRAPTVAELAGMTAPLLDGRRSLAATVVAANGFSTWAGVRSPVIRLYKAYFGRLPDTAGIDYWAGRRAAGWGLDRISQLFATSAEFVTRYGALSNAAFVELVYRNVLGRPPDAAGAAFWTARLTAGGWSRGRVMNAFSESPEHRSKTQATVDVVNLFTGMLRRVPTSGELGTWGPQLAAGTPTTALATALLGSVEYGSAQRCNGHAALCDRSYEAVSFPTTHNAMNNFAEGWLGANQEYGLTRQLTDGVRGLMLDVHWNGDGNLSAPEAPDDVPLLCHGYCKFGWERLDSGLAKIRRFLDANPDEVVTIIFETYVDAAATKAAFEDSGLLPYAYAHPVGQPWPTLRSLVDAGTRLVVLTDSGGGAYPWYLPVWSEAFDNPYSAKTLDELTCAGGRGSDENRLFILNNFLTNIVGQRALADLANANPAFGQRAQACRVARDHLPNFVTVDFYDRGALFDVVDALNGL